MKLRKILSKFLKKKVLVKKLSETATLPTQGDPLAAGYDVFSDETVSIPPLSRKMVSTGISIDGLSGHYARVAPRSGLALKHGVDVFAGVIDESYRGEIKVILFNSDKNEEFIVNKCDRIAQLVFTKINNNIDFVETKNGLTKTDRGSGGFGSTGR